MEKKEKPRLIKCSECSVELPEGDLKALIEHLETDHPEVIVRRLKEIGLPQAAEKFLQEKRRRLDQNPTVPGKERE